MPSIRLIVVLGAAGLFVATAAAATKQQPALSLTSGQTRWFLPGSLQAGALIGCVVSGREIDAKVPAPPTAGTDAGLTFADGPKITIQRHANGATQITCGDTGNSARRSNNLPYVIGQNGLALIRGPNHLDALERVFGQPATSRARSGSSAHCIATWRSVGLVATFGSRRCAATSELVSATVNGSAWSSLTDVHIGDSIAQMSWEDSTAKLVSTRNGRTTWSLASGGASHKAKLLAIGGKTGRITSFVAIVS